MKTIVLTRVALKQLLALPRPVQEAIEAALDSYAIDGRGDVKGLKGSRLARLRVGRDRAIFADDGVTVLAIEITKRDTTTYRGLAAMSDPTFVDTSKGDQLVILTRADYDAMRDRLAVYEAEEDAADIALGERRLADWEAQGRPAYPLAVARLIRDGDSPLKAFRRYRKLTLKALAATTRLAQGYLGDIEKGRAVPDPTTLAALATALETTEASLRPFADAAR